jgi:hypothetical protein
MQASLALFADGPKFLAYIQHQRTCENSVEHISKIISHSKKILGFLLSNPRLNPALLARIRYMRDEWMPNLSKQLRSAMTSAAHTAAITASRPHIDYNTFLRFQETTSMNIEARLPHHSVQGKWPS